MDLAAQVRALWKRDEVGIPELDKSQLEVAGIDPYGPFDVAIQVGRFGTKPESDEPANRVPPSDQLEAMS